MRCAAAWLRSARLGPPWLKNHLDDCTTPLLSEPWVLDMDSTVKTLYGHQEGAEIGYNPHKPGRPSHAYHTCMLSSLRLVLRVDVLPGDEYNVANATDGLWALLDHLGPQRRPALLRGDKSWGIERVMARAEQKDLSYLFRLRMTATVRRSVDRAMQHADWADAGQSWQGKETTLRLVGWSRQRRIILLRRKLARDPAITDHANPAQLRLTFIEIGPDKAVWEYAALVTSLDNEILTLGQLYRDIRLSEAFIYLAVVLDAFSRRVVGWAVASHLRASLALDALEMALASRAVGWTD